MTIDLPSRLADVVGLEATAARAERKALGRSVRGAVPLESHADVPALTERPDPIEVLTSQDATRLADLVPIRHGRMSNSAFAFYRGAAALMAADLAAVPTSGITVQLCGDAHLSNFGLFNGPDRRLVFDLNDFDETLPGPFEWDVKRLAASIAICASHSDIDDDKARKAVAASVRRYRELVRQIAEVDPLRLHYFRIENDMLLAEIQAEEGSYQAKAAARIAEKAQSKDQLRALSRLTEVVDGRRRLVHAPPLIDRLDVLDEQRDNVRAFFDGYLATLPEARRRVLERYRPTDIARKVVGVGSVGTRCLVILCETADGEGLFLQFKEATRSVLEAHLPASEHEQAGQRVVEGQRLMQATGDVFLGWARFDHHLEGRAIDFYFRQLWDGKGSVDVEQVRSRGLRAYGGLCGGALALAHARSGDAALIAGYLGKTETFDQAVTEFAMQYRAINDADHAAHLQAITSGRITAISDL